MKHLAIGAASVLMTAQTLVVLAQPPDFSGTWRIDVGRSRVVEATALAGLVGAGAPPTLHITQPANGTLVLESQSNESHARLYRPGRKISTPVTVGPAGSITATSRWEGRVLVSEGTREFTSASPAANVKEALSLSVDGRTLTIEVSATVGGTSNTSTMVYTRTQDVGACQTWPTPCKTPSR